MDFKAKLYDRKRPDVAIAEINKVLSELLSNNVTINKNVEKIIITAQSLDKNYYDFKELVEAILTVIIGTLETNDFAQSYHNQLDTDVSSLGYIKESDLDTAVSALGYIKKSELESWLTEHGYQPQQ
jgi:flagellar biosynthesis component FlhA